MGTPSDRTTALAAIDAFVEALRHVEIDPATDRVGRAGGTPYLAYPNGRAGETYTHEFFPLDLPAAEALALAREVSGGAPHLICHAGARARAEEAACLAAGYRRSNEWTMMLRPLDAPLARPGDERARPVTDPVTEARAFAAVRDLVSAGHPARDGHTANPAVRQRWVEDAGEPAAFGRLVLTGDWAYVGDIATVPAFRRRGHAGAIFRALLDDALAAGASRALLVSTPMALDLYRANGFAEALPLTEYRSDATG